MSATTATRLVRWVAAALAAAVVAVLVVRLVGGNDGRITPHSLAASVARATGAPIARCVRGRGPWMCAVAGRDATYLVTPVDGHCWRGSLVGDGGGLPGRAQACLPHRDGG